MRECRKTVLQLVHFNFFFYCGYEIQHFNVINGVLFCFLQWFDTVVWVTGSHLTVNILHLQSPKVLIWTRPAVDLA